MFWTKGARPVKKERLKRCVTEKTPLSGSGSSQQTNNSPQKSVALGKGLPCLRRQSEKRPPREAMTEFVEPKRPRVAALVD
ncbi:hypothetical protein D3C85_1713970 [compost metagenome]